MADNKPMKQAQQYKTQSQRFEGCYSLGPSTSIDALTRGGVSTLSSMMEGISKRFVPGNAGKARGPAFSAVEGAR